MEELRRHEERITEGNTWRGNTGNGTIDIRESGGIIHAECVEGGCYGIGASGLDRL